MTRILIGFIFCALLLSCGNNSTNADNPTDNKNGTDNTRVIELADDLNGLWISDSYLKNIEINKSIYLSKKYDTKIQGFNLDKNNLLTDSAFLEGFTEHEGGYSSPIKYDRTTNKFINDIDRLSDYPSFPGPFELNLDGQKTLDMYFPKTKTVDKYRKVAPDFQTEIRRILIAGDYDLTSGNSKIQFDSNGQVHHFLDFKFFELVYDFGEGIEYDAIVFFKSSKSGNWSDGEIYKFKIVSNSLQLQHINTNWETMDHKISDAILTLEKK